jgi:hypothetical protein
VRRRRALSYLLLIPLIKFFGEGTSRARWRPATMPISEMGPKQHPRRLHSLHRRGRGGGGRDHQFGAIAADHPGTGCAAVCAISGSVGSAPAKAATDVPRTDRDLSMKFVGIGIIVLLAAIMLAPRRCT